MIGVELPEQMRDFKLIVKDYSLDFWFYHSTEQIKITVTLQGIQFNLNHEVLYWI
jgi:hypothetical protein